MQIRDILRALRERREALAVDVLARQAGLSGSALEAVLGLEQRRAEEWDRKMAWRLAVASWEQAMLPPGPRDRHRTKVKAQELRYLQQHLDAVARRVRMDGELARLALRGDRLVFWKLGRAERHCRGCLRMGDRVWPLELVARVGPTVCHHGCQCTILGLPEAEAKGWRLRRGRVTSEEVTAGTSMGLMEALRLGEEDERLIEGVAAGAPEPIARRVRARLRGLLLPVRLSEAEVHVSGYTRMTKHGPVHVSSYVRGLAAKVHLDPWPKGASSAASKFHQAIQARDADAAGMAMPELSKALLRSAPKQREAVMRQAQQLRAALVNPTGNQTAPGATVQPPDGGFPVPVPLGVVDRGRQEPWAAQNFPWRLDPAWFGGEKQARAMATQLAANPNFEVEAGSDGAAVVRPKGTVLGTRRRIARALEVSQPRFRQLRVDDDGRAVDDATPLDIGDDEPTGREFASATIGTRTGIRRTSYPNVSGRQLGDSAETTLDSVAARMGELGLAPKDAKPLHPGGERNTANAPVDWVIGDRAIEVKAVALRSASVAPFARRGPLVTIDEKDRARKVNFAQEHGYRSALVISLVDLDGGRAHNFLMDDDPDEGIEEGFRSRRLPTAAINALMDGEARPGDEFGAGARTGFRTAVYLGPDALGFNPLTANPTELSGLRTEQVAGARKRNAEGVSRARTQSAGRKVVRQNPPMEKPERVRAARPSAMPKAELDDRVASMIRSGVAQSTIGKELGVSQPTVSRSVKRLRAAEIDLTVNHGEQVRRLEAEGLTPAKIAQRTKLSMPYVRDLMKGGS